MYCVVTIGSNNDDDSSNSNEEVMDTTLNVIDVVEEISKESIQSVDVPFEGLHDCVIYKYLFNH